MGIVLTSKEVVLVDGKLVHIGEWDYQVVWEGEEGTITNPLPEGAVECSINLIRSAKGRWLLPNDWENLRIDAYPAVHDQLDAMWKGGDCANDMALRIAAVKSKYPKP